MKDPDDRPEAPVSRPKADEREESPRPDDKVVENYREWAEAEREEARRLERYQQRSSKDTEVRRDADEGGGPSKEK